MFNDFTVLSSNRIKFYVSYFNPTLPFIILISFTDKYAEHLS